MDKPLETTLFGLLFIMLDVIGIMIAHQRATYFRTLGLHGMSSYKGFYWLFNLLQLAFGVMLIINLAHLLGFLVWPLWIMVKLVVFKLLTLSGMLVLGYSLEGWVYGRRQKKGNSQQ